MKHQIIVTPYGASCTCRKFSVPTRGPEFAIRLANKHNQFNHNYSAEIIDTRKKETANVS